MKKTLSILLILVFTLALALPGLAEASPPEKAQLVVNGTASVTLEADLASIELGAQTRGQSVAEAHQANAAIMEKVIAELGKLGIDKKDIRTTQYNVYFEPDYSLMSAAGMPQSGNYTVTNMLQITIRDIGQVSTAIDTAAKAGANNVYSLMFQSTKSEEAYKQALELAVENGKEKARVLAAAAGQALGRVVKVEAGEYYGGPMTDYLRTGMGAEAAKPTPILSGDVSVSATVILTFELD